MSKKLAVLFLVVFLGGLFFPLVSLAAHTYTACQDIDENGKCVGKVTVCYQGLVPCGLGKPYWVGGTIKADCLDGSKNEGGIACQFCHFFVMIDGIIDFVFKYIIPPIAVLMLMVGGIMFYFAGGNPTLVSQGKKLIINVVIGLFLVYGAFMIVGFVLIVLGAADFAGMENLYSEGIIKINCQIKL